MFEWVFGVLVTTAIWMLLLYVVIRTAVREGILAADRTRKVLRQEEEATAGQDPHLRRMRAEAERIGLQLRLASDGFQLVSRDGGDVVMTGTLDEITEALTR